MKIRFFAGFSSSINDSTVDGTITINLSQTLWIIILMGSFLGHLDLQIIARSLDIPFSVLYLRPQDQVQPYALFRAGPAGNADMSMGLL